MSNKLAKRTQSLLLPPGADKHTRSRMGMYMAWLETAGTDWKSPDLAAYRDSMLSTGKAPATVKAHLSVIRAQYKRITKDNQVRDMLFSMAPAQSSPADKAAFVNEAITRLSNAVDPELSKVSTTTRQDTPDASQTRLTRRQAEDLLYAPGMGTLKGRRDTALIAVCLCTGIREDEACSLDIADLRQSLGGELAIHVRHGKGNKERLVPYGEFKWCLALVDSWLKAAEIKDGAVFRAYYYGFKKQRGRMGVRDVERIVRCYPYTDDNGELQTVAPHDLRRTYARACYDAGMDIVAIQQNLGHSSISTTLKYIGELDARKRAPAGDLYRYDISRLRNNHSASA